MSLLSNDHLKLIELLKHNPRKSFLEISRIMGLSVEQIFETYNYLKENNYFKTISILNLPNLEVINIMVVISQMPNQNDIIYFFKKNKNVNALFLTDREIICFLTFFNFNEYDFFISNLEFFGVDNIEIYFIKEIL